MSLYSDCRIGFPVCFVFEVDGFSFAPRAEVWESGILVKTGCHVDFLYVFEFRCFHDGIAQADKIGAEFPQGVIASAGIHDDGVVYLLVVGGDAVVVLHVLFSFSMIGFRYAGIFFSFLFA